jgi:hypothetical protein
VKPVGEVEGEGDQDDDNQSGELHP